MSDTPRTDDVCAGSDSDAALANRLTGLCRELERALATLREENARHLQARIDVETQAGRDAITHLNSCRELGATLSRLQERTESASRDREQAIQVVRELVRLHDGRLDDGVVNGQPRAWEAARALVHQDEQQKGGQ